MINHHTATLLKMEQDILERNPDIIKFRAYKANKVTRIEDIFGYLFNRPSTFLKPRKRRPGNATVTLDGKIHCQDRKSRSYEDAYILCKHYFPDVTFIEMYRLLRSYVNPPYQELVTAYKKKLAEYDPIKHEFQYWSFHNEPNQPFWYCSDIGRKRFSYQFELDLTKK